MTTREFPAQLMQGPFLLSTAADLGIGGRQLLRAGFVRVRRGVYAPAQLASHPWLTASAVSLLVPHAVFSHDTAAHLLGLPRPPQSHYGRPGPVHVTVPPHLPAPQLAGVRRHRRTLPDDDVLSMHPRGPFTAVTSTVFVTTAIRTVHDLLLTWPLVDLVALADAAIRTGLADHGQLTARVCTGARDSRARTGRRVAALLDPGAESPQESRLRVLLVTAGIPAPHCNLDVFDDSGGWLGRGDMVWPECRVIVEYDGAQHREPGEQRVELDRRNRLLGAGWLLLSYCGADLATRSAVIVAAVWRALRERGWPAPDTAPERGAGLSSLEWPR